MLEQCKLVINHILVLDKTVWIVHCTGFRHLFTDMNISATVPHVMNHPSSLGLGISMVAMSWMIGLNYVIIITYAIYMFFASMTGDLPFSDCTHTWNTQYCIRAEELKTLILNGTALNITLEGNDYQHRCRTNTVHISHTNKSYQCKLYLYYIPIYKLQHSISESH